MGENRACSLAHLLWESPYGKDETGLAGVTQPDQGGLFISRELATKSGTCGRALVNSMPRLLVSLADTCALTSSLGKVIYTHLVFPERL